MTSPQRWATRVVAVAVAVGVAYLGVTAWQVWRASRVDQARPVGAVVVLGAAQYNGTPSPVLVARLEHTLALWHRGVAPVIVVTGGRAVGDRYSEAAAAARYLAAHGVPQAAILREVSGRDSWQSLDATSAFLRKRGTTTVVLVSDPFHDARISLMSSELGLTGWVSPTRTSPIHGSAVLPYMAKETVEVAVGRIIGFRRVARLTAHFGGSGT